MRTIRLAALGAACLSRSSRRRHGPGLPAGDAARRRGHARSDPRRAAALRDGRPGQPARQRRCADPARAGGAELKADGFSFLAEGEGTLALADDYNDTLPGNGVEPFPTVADPENLELNRLQVGYMKNGTGVTLGRQRIMLDNQRFVGNVGWRQNEQTFDAVRGQAKFGPVVLDATYSISQRTVFGVDSPNEHFDGDFVFLNGGVDLPVVDAKAFAYLLDYDTRLAFSSQTYGVLATGERRHSRRSASSPGWRAMRRRATTAPTRSPTTPTTSTRSSASACSASP